MPFPHTTLKLNPEWSGFTGSNIIPKYTSELGKLRHTRQYKLTKNALFLLV